MNTPRFNPNSFKDLTIVIPTYNSTFFLKRSLMYLSSFKLKLNIIVADSSRDDNKLENDTLVKNTPYLSILHLKDFDPNIKPLLKWLKAIESVKTEYVVFCADDDFISIKGLEESLSFLKNNPHYSAAEGKNIYFVNFNISGKSLFNWKNGDTWDSLEDEPMGRLHKYALHYQPLIYAVYRKNNLIHFFRVTEKNDSLEFPFGELLPAFMTVITGKIKRLDCFYSARDKTIDFYRRPPLNFIQQYKDDNSFNKRFKLFSEPLIEEYSKLYPYELNGPKSVQKELLLLFKLHQSKKYVIWLNRFFGKKSVNTHFSLIYSIINWLFFDIFKIIKLSLFIKNNDDFNRIKWFVQHYPIKRPQKSEKFIP